MQDSPKVRALIVKFAIMQTANYETFLRQCMSNTINQVLRQDSPHAKESPHEEGGDRTQKVCQVSGEAVNKNNRVLAQVLSWGRFARVHLNAITVLYLYYLIKFRIIDMISYDAMLSNYKFLDCFILGRFHFFGRASMVSGKVASLFMGVFFTYRWIIYLWAPKFKFFAFEFMLSSCQDVRDAELKQKNGPLRKAAQKPREHQSSVRDYFAKTGFCLSHEERQENDERMRATKGEPAPRALHKTPQNSIFFVQRHCDLNSDDGTCRGQATQLVCACACGAGGSGGCDNKWILRPNRTSKSFRILNLLATVLTYWSVFALIFWGAVIYYVMAGSVLTNFGFELSYFSCAVWLREIQASAPVSASGQMSNASTAERTSAQDFSYIYRAPKVLAHEIRIADIPYRIPFNRDDLQPATPYNVARITFDIVENHLIQLESLLHFIALFCMIAIQSCDVVLNARGIKAQLLSLIERLEENRRQLSWRHAHFGELVEYEEKQQQQQSLVLLQSHSGVQHDTHSNDLSSGRSASYLSAAQVDYKSQNSPDYLRTLSLLAANAAGSDQQKLSEQIGDLQALLCDHFDTITSGYSMFISFVVTLIGFLWLGYSLAIVKWMSVNKSFEWEIVMAETGGTAIAIQLMSCGSIVRSHNVQLYRLIARAMALDSNWALTKPRWITILKFYQPKPLYCFTVFGSAEISWLLCLKLILWILSAFILLANYIYTRTLS